MRDAWLGHLPERPRLTPVIAPSCRDEQFDALLAEPVERVRKRVGFGESEFVIVCVGKVHPMKGQDLVVRALPELMALEPRARLVLVGSITAEAGAALGAIERLGLQHRV
ncbi:MAG: glycosyltransferase, partial [Deinococcales bacterium]